MTINATALSGALPGNARQTDSYVITTANQKGGVGKTMVAMALAMHTAAAHGRALVVDVDPQATAYDLTQVMQDPGYDVVQELDPLQLTRIRQLRDYDTILVDCPGSLEGNGVLDEVLRRSSFVVIPYDHVPESLQPTIRTARRVGAASVPYAAVITKADPRLGPDWVTDAWQLLESQGIRCFRRSIPLYRAWPNSLQAGIPLSRWNERYAPRLREAIGHLHTEILLDLGRHAPAGGE